MACGGGIKVFLDAVKRPELGAGGRERAAELEAEIANAEAIERLIRPQKSISQAALPPVL